MTRLAITGHRGLPADTEQLVDAALRALVATRAGTGLTAISCLADGADTMFARAVLDAGGALVAVIPAAEYRDGLPADHHPIYDALLAAAGEVIRMPRVESDGQAHLDASVRMLDDADELIAVWDGKPARGFGGTADVVDVARERGIPVVVVWPEGARRD